jgi:hypothetical protein
MKGSIMAVVNRRDFLRIGTGGAAGLLCCSGAAPRWCKQLFLNALELLLPEPLVRVDGPTTMIATVNEQPDEKRWIVHLLNYVPERRGKDFDIIEDVFPLYHVNVTVRAPSIKRIRLVPQQKSLEFARSAGRVEFFVPEIVGHQMVELSYV